MKTVLAVEDLLWCWSDELFEKYFLSTWSEVYCSWIISHGILVHFPGLASKRRKVGRPRKAGKVVKNIEHMRLAAMQGA